jgi:hypothetical protein
MSQENTWPGFVPGGGGHLAYLVLWRVTCPCWLSPVHSDLDSTQILTWQRSAKSQTICQVTNAGTTLTRQVPGSSAPPGY